MQLKEWLNDLNKLIDANPEILELPVVYARDDEGNGYQYASYSPSLGAFDRLSREFYSQDQYEDQDDDLGEKVICLN
jgi:hypothetical protein